ncbi:glycosyl hydrolase [Anaerobium acetethylicum]|uniref:Mannan endo-1,4-beta-mannosidase n=1 Tax=Anaerobium acetethylicum TaxID=1619234 RepID=A0A1D3TRV1_9FIRM|nr:glycosyl hydrolase [Anaerobium acetethylicum]SCP96412.1 mannan endo-1,4-beta-mannosidase [Anaerobium acetethylicum]
MKKIFVKRIASLLLVIPLCISSLTHAIPADASIALAAESSSPERLWDFSDGTQGWIFDGSWAGDSYHGTSMCTHDPEKGMLKVDMDFSQDSSNGWCQPGISFSEETGIDYSAFTTLSFDLYYDSAAFTTGQITIKAVSDNVFQEQMTGFYNLTTEDAGGTLKKATIAFQLDSSYAKTETPGKLMLLIVGNSTDYKGSLWFDNIRLHAPVIEDNYVDATIRPATQTVLSDDSSALTVNETNIPYSAEIQLADPDANSASKAVYQYLKAVGESDAVIYGHMEDTVLKAGTSELTDSDTKDLTGSIAGLTGLDCGNLFIGFAAKYNARHPEAVPIPETTEGNIRAAALFTNEAFDEGALMTLSAHMPNFAFATVKDSTAAKTYDRYDYTMADSYNLKGSCMNQILPGGAYHEQFNAYLDMIAEYARQVNGALLFRPFHENTGSWFWWGKAFCDAETYKSVFKYTVEYLRDTKNVHNILYLYGPGSEASSLVEYGERYPGDEYVDLIGFDTYDSNPVPDEEGYTFQTNFENSVRLTDAFAKQHNKLFAVTETGISGLQDTGNRRPGWFTEIQDILTKDAYDCCYFMLWTNYSDSSFYTPYASSVNEDGTLHGHELMDPFIEFYNNEKSIFASDQKSVLAVHPASPSITAWEQASGYFTLPVAGSRILTETAVHARLNKEGVSASICASNGIQEIPLETVVDGNTASAILTADVLTQLGEAANGKIILYAGETKLQEIPVVFNIPEQEKDPLLVDDFESYYGESSILNGNWAVNKDSGSNLVISLSEGNVFEGEYALQFSYDETKTGWAGAVTAKEADWSACNALQFWVAPDGKNQKTVIQINTADGGSYEAYLNSYVEYAVTTEPLLVTLPFSEFVDKGGRGPLTSQAAGAVTSFGLWLNAISDSSALVDGRVSGTIYYDRIIAVASSKTAPSFETAADLSIAGMTTEVLQKAVDDAEAFIKKEYTKESWRIFKDSLKYAEKVLKNEQADQETLYHAFDALRHAEESLIEIEKGYNEDVM